MKYLVLVAPAFVGLFVVYKGKRQADRGMRIVGGTLTAVAVVAAAVALVG